ncbi:MAG TPA: iron chelate uptake ABC transporter family permease subunit [Candidatus Krumholzibacteria bacterium]|nr:iron chelate uptake ABC transporter family permease subunit [Candidatus Krumholzibacteria bacterium]HPD70813.1 iron chelate uptake ABC transporter family permease subunit [Candidatus Krumholzibacteria bacterium]HRY39487.1 iron chelate uptake ABC transporter family permease subunit [Candidatus Krumholzibacteria bacterium]
MAGFIGMMAAPVVVALVLVVMHGYLGGHVVRRGVIFVDIALAQVAAFGVALSLFFGAEVGTDTAWLAGLGATFLGALLISATRNLRASVPQEAYIGIIYAVFSAAMILVLTQVPHGSEEIHHLLVGTILWVTWHQVAKTALLYAVLGAVLWWAHGRLTLISEDPDAARARGLRLACWDLLFYAVLGTVVTSSVQIAGVLLVFTLLVVPTVMACRRGCVGRIRHLGFVLMVGVLAVVLGAGASYWLDLPTGAAIVCVFGLLLGLQVVAEALFLRRT